ncbi:MAG: penicillin-binding protein activator [Gammaproteobacteria bacterium]
MTVFTFNWRIRLCAGLLAALLAGCGGMPPLVKPGTDRLQTQAQALEDAGNYQGAAQVYLQAATGAAIPEKYRLQLLAAGSLIRGNELASAAPLLDQLQAAGLTGVLQQHYDIRRAALELAQQHPEQALALLQTPPADETLRIEYHRLRAEALLQNSQFFPSARERILLDPLLSDPAQQLANQRALWDALNNLTDNELQQLRKAPPPDALSGWMELVELTRLYLQQPDALAEVIPHWQQRYPEHPASRQFTARLLETMRTAGQAPEQVAVLLPLQGELAEVAGAVRDGILAAYYDTPEGSKRPVLRIYDSGTSPDQAVAAYQQAVADGARFVIGPLRKEAVDALAGLQPLTVPVLGLNQSEDQGLMNPGLYQFGLAPEDEAREAARLAWRNGLTRSVALLPDNDWGERVYSAFADEWQALGGRILETGRYNDSEADHGKVISALLNLDASKARYQQLARALGTRLEFEPRRRQDIDFVFLIASPRQARLIRPQLSFYHASSLPVYATSRVYTGIPDDARDSDMNGIVFCDMPWTLESRENWSHLQGSVAEFWPDSSSRYARLLALGIDAYRIIPYLGELGNNMPGAYHGVTGNLSLGEHGRLNRTLRCARFQDGVPVLLEQTTSDSATDSGGLR